MALASNAGRMCQVADVGLGGAPGSPWARRGSRPRWRDPRLLLGVLLVLVSVLLGARILAAADDTVPVWAVSRDLPTGGRLDAAAVEVVRVRMSDAGPYLDGLRPIPAGAVVTHPLAAHELLPSSAVAPAGSQPTVQLPLGVDSSSLPADLGAGDLVDVWVVPTDGRARARLALASVVVVSADEPTSFGAGSTRTVVVGLQSGGDQLTTVLPALASGDVVLVRRAS